MAVNVDIFNPQISVIAHGLEGKTIMIYGGNNLGKAQPVSTLIPTPEGMRKLGDLRPGDYVFDRNGKPTQVLQIFDQGLKENYRVFLSDGRSTFCNDEHIWTTYTSKGNFKERTLREMIDTGIKQGFGYRYQIPTSSEVEYDEEDYNVDPYVVGAFIGNGCNTYRALTLSSQDEGVVKEVSKLIGAKRYKRNSENNYSWSFYLEDDEQYKAGNGDTTLMYQTKKYFRGLPEITCLSHEKSIPKQYLYGSIEQRLALVQGLMDTDGSIASPSELSHSFPLRYDTTSKKLAVQLIEVLNSLGISASLNVSIRENKRDCYYVQINMPNEEKYKLFRASQKKVKALLAKAEPDVKNYDRISIVRVEKMPSKEKMRCIYVDNKEHLYLTNDYIVTHNTAQAVRAEKPYVFACESGLNGQSGVAYNRINTWYDFKTAVRQFTSKATVDQAKAMYKTIVIDEVYASAMFCQDYVCQSYGNGAIDLGDDTGNTKLNLYRLYEKEYWREINKLVNSGYTVIFIAHETIEDGYAFPKGDKKRCLAPIIDNCDIVAYVHSNGVDEEGNPLLSSAYFAQTDRFFARSRYTHMVPKIDPFTIENLVGAINDAIAEEEKVSGVKSVDYEVQKEQNVSVVRTYDELMEEMQQLGEEMVSKKGLEELQGVVESTLGQGKKASDLKKGQEQIIQVLIDAIKEALNE